MSLVTIDFETEGIESRPDYPPKPVGVAVKFRDLPASYLSWGHPTNNNATYEDAKNMLGGIWDSGVQILCHNSKFDLDVAEVFFDLPMPDWKRVHDTMYLLYLYNPHARTVSLKPSAQSILDLPPEEQDELRDWVVSHVRCKPKQWGAHIADAPGDIVGKYAIGDVDRTFALFEYLFPHISENGMVDAYNRERQLMPILLETEQRGMLVDTEGLEDDLEYFEKEYTKVDEEICTILDTKALHIDSRADLADAMESAGLVDNWILTASGQRSTAADNLRQCVTHPRLLGVLAYRGALKTCLTTFMRPWNRLSAPTGRLYTSWHQVRNPDGFGTRTGRISSSKPNLTNVPLEYKVEVPEGYPPLPQMRQYLIPEEGHVWLKRDYSQQEVRILAHFEDGSLMRAWKENPNLDPHQMAADIIREQTGHIVERPKTKIVAFSILYGSGVRHLSETLECQYHEAAMTKELYLSAFPDVRTIMADVKQRGAAGLPVRTVGGRLMFSELPHPDTGRRFDYKLLNHLIQGSSGDVTKQAMINYDARKENGQMLAQVYDELNITAPAEYAVQEMDILRQSMEDVPLDVKLLTEGYMGDNWAEADK